MKPGSGRAEPADAAVELDTGDRFENQLTRQARAVGVHHARLHIEVVGAGDPRCEFEVAAPCERFGGDNVAQLSFPFVHSSVFP